MTAEMLEQRFDEVQVPPLRRQAKAKPLEAALTISDEIGKTKLAVQRRLDSSKVAKKNAGAYRVHFHDQDRVGCFGMQMLCERIADQAAGNCRRQESQGDNPGRRRQGLGGG